MEAAQIRPESWVQSRTSWRNKHQESRLLWIDTQLDKKYNKGVVVFLDILRLISEVTGEKTFTLHGS